jgi:cell wall-associated NlpC family hydrolase
VVPGRAASPPAGWLTPPPDGFPPIGTWTSEQVGNAARIITVGAQLGVPVRGQVIAVATAIAESFLINLPDLGEANDHDSLGLFQQRPSQGWGTPAQVMDPVHAATAFYQHLLAVPGWQTMPLAQAAQAVQQSAAQAGYGQWEGQASIIVATLSGRVEPSGLAAACDPATRTAPPPGFHLPPGTPPAVLTAIMWAFAQLGTPYSFGGDCTAAHSGDPARQCDCSSLMQQAYKAAGITLPRVTTDQVHAGTKITDPAMLLPGDLILIPGSAGTMTAPRHVGMYLGQGLIIQAPKTGDVVKITKLGSWLYEIAKGEDGNPYGTVAAVAGVSYILAVALLRWRS